MLHHPRRGGPARERPEPLGNAAFVGIDTDNLFFHDAAFSLSHQLLQLIHQFCENFHGSINRFLGTHVYTGNFKQFN